MSDNKKTLQQKKFQTLSGVALKPVYTAADLAQWDYATKLGAPGEYPYTRGIHASGYRGKLWTMRQFSGFGSPVETNQRFHYLLAAGQTGLSTAFDMPVLMGYNPDHELSLGEVGREGVSVATLDDMEQLFAGIPLDQVTVSMTVNASATVIMALYFAMAKRRGISFDQLGGTIQNDALKEFIAQKEWICPPTPSVKLSCDIIEYCSEFAPKFNPISISGYHIREAGATAAQELAFTLANGVAYIEHCLQRGMVLEKFVPRLSFFFDVHNDFFEEIAKLRAARRLWAKLIRERFGCNHARSQQLRMHAQTAGVSLTAQQPHNNVARVTLQALAAVLAGVQSLHTNSMDETLALPTEEAVKVALRTQQIIAEESGVINSVDPLAGSYFLESLTDQIQAEAEKLIAKIDTLGGMLPAVTTGYPQKALSDSAFEFQKRVEVGDYRTVGVNVFVDSDQVTIPVHKVDPGVEAAQKQRLAEFIAKRNQALCCAKIEQLRQDCQAGRNVMPTLIEVMEAGGTLGEVCDVYRDVFGVYQDPAFV
jgi:methylmalonyl-CoA mutase N-terminal domain/subunit